MESNQSEIAMPAPIGLSELTIPSDAIIARNQSIYAVELDDELACIEEATGNYYGLNMTGRMIWGLLESPLTLQKLTQLMIEQYPDDSEAISEDILFFLADLNALKIISIRLQRP